IDIEMSFAEEEDIYAEVEKVMRAIFKEVKGVEDLEFRRVKYVDAMALYGSDKPDLRFGNPMKDLSPLFKDTEFTVFKNTLENGGVIKGLKFENAASAYSRKELDKLQDFVKIYKAKALAYLKYDNDTFSGSLHNALSEEEKEMLKKEWDVHNGDLLFIIADQKKAAEAALGALRVKAAKTLGLIPEGQYAFAWITDFPMYEYSEEEGRYVAAHHPFTSPKLEDVDKLLTDKEHCYSRAYDLVLNGYELLSGSVRIHDSELQAKVFEALQLTKEEAQAKFGFFLEAFDYGTPPHCGVGIGLERLIMILSDTDNIKDVVAFPKTASATCLMSDAPNTVDPRQLKDLGIEISKK
ncbi:MAG: aspartate--tRNA ligase, partial [Erysipelotrichaceae bacterium]|nr:aspartate--tRNA ligase [Erysipelotrichaceae bacterium]